MRRALLLALLAHGALAVLLLHHWYPNAAPAFITTDVLLSETASSKAELAAGPPRPGKVAPLPVDRNSRAPEGAVAISPPTIATPNQAPASVSTSPGGNGPEVSTDSTVGTRAGAEPAGNILKGDPIGVDRGALVASAQARIRAHKYYPELARRRGIEGTAIVRFRIEANGQVTDASVVRSVDPLLDEAALRAVKDAAPFPHELVGPVEVSLDFRLTEN